MDTSINPEQIPGQQPIKIETGPGVPVKTKEKFFPSGAIAFFILLVILSLGFWYGIYFLMIQRS